MKIDFAETLKTLDGQALHENPVDPKSPAVTLRTLAVNALMAVFEDEKNLSGEEKVKRYDLAFLIHNSKDGAVEVAVEDVAMVKKLIGKSYAPLLVGQAWKMLEG